MSVTLASLTVTPADVAQVLDGLMADHRRLFNSKYSHLGLPGAMDQANKNVLYSAEYDAAKALKKTLELHQAPLSSLNPEGMVREAFAHDPVVAAKGVPPLSLAQLARIVHHLSDEKTAQVQAELAKLRAEEAALVPEPEELPPTATLLPTGLDLEEEALLVTLLDPADMNLEAHEGETIMALTEAETLAVRKLLARHNQALEAEVAAPPAAPDEPEDEDSDDDDEKPKPHGRKRSK